MSGSFSVERFESCVYGGRPDDAIELLSQLNTLFRDNRNTNPVTLMDSSTLWPPPMQNWLQERFASRMAAGIVSLLGNADFPAHNGAIQPSIGLPSAHSGFIRRGPSEQRGSCRSHAFLPRLAEDGTVQLPFPDAVKRVNLLCNSESRLPLDYSACMRADPAATLSLAIAAAGELLPGSVEAHRSREALLEWLDQALAEVNDLETIELDPLAGLYMNCT